MAAQKIVWTVLPHGRVEKGPLEGRIRVSIVVSPRLSPQAASEQTLQAFADWENWPKTLDTIKFLLRTGSTSVPLERVSKADPGLWTRLLPATTPVAGFVFQDMAKVNLRSFPVRNVLGLLRTHYGALAVNAGGTHPTLLPWRNAHPTLKGMLTQLGTATQTINFGDRSIEVPLPGFDRFFDDDNREGIEQRLGDLVFGPRSRLRGRAASPGVGRQGEPSATEFPMRALPPDWVAPAGAGAAASIMSQFSTAGEYALYQANRFYRREPLTKARRDELEAQGQLRRPKLHNIPPAPAVPDWDFHRIVASYADLPHLLRALGLVIDCVLPEDSPIDQAVAVSANGSAAGLMGLDVIWGDPHAPEIDSRPTSAWHADKERFTMRARTDDHGRGMLRLRNAHDRWNEAKDSQFDVFQVDPDGGALKTVDYLLTAQNLVAKSLALGKPGNVTYTTGDKQPVAALRSGGLGVSRHGRAELVAQGAASAALKNPILEAGGPASTGVVLFAEDVLRGYRVDVQPSPGGSPGKWHSLCRREGSYRFTNSTDTISGVPEDEGYVKGASTTTAADTANGADPDDHYLHETMFRWAGWSLVAPRPGRTLRPRVDPASGVQGEVPEDVTDEPPAGKGNGLAVTFQAAKGSLPRLRFGVPYRFRARIVDLAGNSLRWDDPSLEQDPDVTQPVSYARFEPIDPPALVPRARMSEGESLERMVIRSNWDQTPEEYLDSEAFAEAIELPASADFDYTAVNERHVVPPKASQLQCEQHAQFDPFFADPGSIKKGYEIAAREAGTLFDPLPSAQVELVTPQSVANVATTSAIPPSLPTPDNPTGDRLAPGQYVIHREAHVQTPYLPDPASGGLALRGMPGHGLPGVGGPMVLGPGAEVVQAPNEELVLLVWYEKAWPDSRGIRIVLAERKASLTDPGCNEQFPDEGAPKWNASERVLTFFVAKGRIVRLRYSSFAEKHHLPSFGLPAWTGAGGNQSFVRNMALAGCEWMMTPYRSLVFVHATQQPVCEPEFQALSAVRGLGDQHAHLEARLRMHGPSTGKFEVEAAWKEWVDDLQKEGPELIESSGKLGEVLLTENHVNQFGLSQVVSAQKPPEGSPEPRARGDRHEFGDTKFRLIDYTIRATTRFREYLPEALYAQTDLVTRVGPVAEGPKMIVGADDDPGAPVLQEGGNDRARNTVVRASAPPDDPLVLYTVPTFRWSRNTGANSLSATRLGNGLRVWLDRPWFSSGNGELLGVIILGENKPFTDIPSKLVPLVTQWGLDPLWDTVLPKHRTHVTDFPARVHAELVALREFPDVTVQVVGHRVRWDGDRRQWYCDIELNPGSSYMPFVRLALVRYQPNAIQGAEISKVVLAEFSQVLPRRRAVFERAGSVVTFRFHGVVPEHGPMMFPIDSEYQDVSFIPPFGAPGESGRNSIELVLQTRDPNIDSDLAWSDAQVLASGVLGVPAQPSPLPPVVSPVGSVVGTVPSVARPSVTPGRATTPARREPGIGGSVDLGRIEAGPVVEIGPIGTLIDPVVWEATVTLPQSGNKPARLAVREYERYYTDRTVPERRGNQTFRRRVVEERLVYTEIFNL